MPEREGERSARDIITIRDVRDPRDGKSKPKVGSDVKEAALQLENLPLLTGEQEETPEVTETTPAHEEPSTEPAKDTPQSALRTAPEQPAEPTEPEPAVEPEPDDLPPEPEHEPERQPQGRKLRMPDGTTQWVTVDEAFAGYLRQSDYTRKRQADAEHERQTQARYAEATKLRDQYAGALQQLETTLKEATPQEPDWAAERRRLTPEQYLDLRETWDAYDKNRATVAAESKRVTEEKQKDFENRRKGFVETESRALLDKIPEWTDDETYSREYALMLRHAKAIGFSPDEVNGTVDHRLLVLLREAALGRATNNKNATPAGTSAAPRKKPGIIRTVSPGSALDGVPRPSERKTEKRRAFEQLRKSGRKEDAVTVFEHLIDEGKIE